MDCDADLLGLHSLKCVTTLTSGFTSWMSLIMAAVVKIIRGYLDLAECSAQPRDEGSRSSFSAPSLFMSSWDASASQKTPKPFTHPHLVSAFSL